MLTVCETTTAEFIFAAKPQTRVGTHSRDDRGSPNRSWLERELPGDAHQIGG